MLTHLNGLDGRQTYSNDKESTRDKFILVTWIGSSVRVMRKVRTVLPLRLSLLAHLQTLS